MCSRYVLALFALVTITSYFYGSARAFADDSPGPKDETKVASTVDIEFFEKHVRPLLVERCAECHNAKNPESGLSVESRESLLRGGKLGPAIAPGKPKESLLISAVNHDEFLKMPPKDKLSTTDLLALSKWVASGAPWPSSPSSNSSSESSQTVASATGKSTFTREQTEFWSYQPLARPVPPVNSQFAPRSAIDAFVQQAWADKRLTPAPLATKRDLLRRATYDLIGLPPTEEAYSRFESNTDPDAFERELDRLLASPRYGERWGRHWLDVARFAESNGLDENIAYANAFRYRDWVIRSLNADKPYDRFVQEQIAGDLLSYDPSADASYGEPLDRYIATGFLAIGAKMLAEDDPMKMQMDIIDEQLSTMCQAFMGLTIGCARCHDHKYDPLPATDYYALAGIFKSTQTMENHNVVARWYERPLMSEDEAENVKRIDKELEQVKGALAELEKNTRKQATKAIRETISSALPIVSRYREFENAIRDKQTTSHKSSEAIQVRDGYALIEAEHFQQGNVEVETNNYGKDIGILLSRGAGFTEYEVDIQHGGTYAIEVRHAAQESRPVRLLVDSVEVTDSMSHVVTGSWLPDTQTWFIEALVDLAAGKHKIRFESKQVFPHIDKFALVYQPVPGSESARRDWPFGSRPVALSMAFESSDVPLPISNLWHAYFTALNASKDSSSEARKFWMLWLAASHASGDAVRASTSQYVETHTDLPQPLREQLLKSDPANLRQLADAYASVINAALPKSQQSTKELQALREVLVNKESPLAGPGKLISMFTGAEDTKQAQEFRMRIATLQSQRPEAPMAMGVTEAKPEDLKVHLRGSHLVLGQLAPRRFPQILVSTTSSAPQISSGASGRLELARWMTGADHPLTSRVMANRIWNWHFGRGIVPSVDNFGMLGLKPTHPELLDWLANELSRGQWSIKRMHRVMMLTDTYQRSSQHVEASHAADAENEWLWRFRRRRLTAEETRDAILQAGERLDLTMYGSLMSVENHKYVNSTGNAAQLNYDNARRSVYLPIIRSGVFDVLQTLDFPDPAMLTGVRQTSTVAPQALLMMNSELVSKQTRFIADQLATKDSVAKDSVAKDSALQDRDDHQLVNAVYLRVLQRLPDEREANAATRFLSDALQTTGEQNRAEALQGLCRVLMSTNEFSYVE